MNQLFIIFCCFDTSVIIIVALYVIVCCPNEWKVAISGKVLPAHTYTLQSFIHKYTEDSQRAGTEQKGLRSPLLSPSSSVGENPLSNFGANLLI